ncbi:MAG: hypothetical protein WA126_10245 [Thermodesulfovibrionales bacterium]
MGKSITIILLILLSFLLNCSDQKAREQILFDFESPSELDQLEWECHTMYSLSDEHRTHGLKSLKLELYPSDGEDYLGLTPIITKNNWSGFKYFCFDIYNPGVRQEQISLRIDDKKDYPDYNDRYNQSINLKSGQNNICIPLNEMATSATNRKINLQNIYKVLLFMSNPEKKVVLYMDYVRLVR